MKTGHLNSTKGEEGDLGPGKSITTENPATEGYT